MVDDFSFKFTHDSLHVNQLALGVDARLRMLHELALLPVPFFLHLDDLIVTLLHLRG
jgi:hypothetical protein